MKTLGEVAQRRRSQVGLAADFSSKCSHAKLEELLRIFSQVKSSQFVELVGSVEFSLVEFSLVEFFPFSLVCC